MQTVNDKPSAKNADQALPENVLPSFGDEPAKTSGGAAATGDPQPGRTDAGQGQKAKRSAGAGSDGDKKQDALPSFSGDETSASGKGTRKSDAHSSDARSVKQKDGKVSDAPRGGSGADGAKKEKKQSGDRTDKPEKKDRGAQTALTKKQEQPETSGSAKTVFILSMILLSPLILLVLLVIALFFAAHFAVLILAAGVLSLALVAVVVGGVALALVGITYGVINILTSSGFNVVAGVYELGLGLAITGVTIILSALLYSVITGLIPFIMKKLWQLVKLIAAKIKDLIVRIYQKSTSTEI